MFDLLLLLSEGRTMYFGTAAHAVRHVFHIAPYLNASRQSGSHSGAFCASVPA